jgi:uncharacterized protein
MGSTAITAVIDLGLIAQRLGLPVAAVQSTVELLDAGNTVPFITRYRRDQTGGLDEEQIRLIAEAVARQNPHRQDAGDQAREARAKAQESAKATGAAPPDDATTAAKPHQSESLRKL